MALQDLARWHVGLMACLIAVLLVLGIFLIVRD